MLDPMTETDADKSGPVLRVRFAPSHTAVAIRDAQDGLNYELLLPARAQLEAEGFVTPALAEGVRISVFGRIGGTNPFRLFVLSAKWITVHTPALGCTGTA